MRYAQEEVRPYGNDGNKREQVERMFNHIAPTYDALNHTMSLGIDKRWRRQAVEIMKRTRPETILDIATGTGDFALLMAERLRPKAITAIDISEGMMEVARRKMKSRMPAAPVRFVKEDCTALSFSDGSFDAATATFGLRNFVELDKALSEVYRVLKTGGRFIALELSVPPKFPMKQLFLLYANGLMPLVGKAVSKDGDAYTYLPRSIHAFPQGEVMTEILKRAGFRKVTFRRLTCGICTLYTATK